MCEVTQARLAEWHQRLLTDWAQTREELIRQLKADLAVQHIPVVFITATHRNPVWEAEGLRLGARRFLYRPLDSDELLREIQACLQHDGPEPR